MGSSGSRRNEEKIVGSELYLNDISLLQASTSLCKLVTDKKIASGYVN